MQVSVVIIAKNEALNIIDCIHSARKISNDIIVIDSGSTDSTVTLAEQQQATVHSLYWKGYGHARNAGAALASNEWIFSLDADERITDELASLVTSIDPPSADIIYGFRRENYFEKNKIVFGELAHDRVLRVYNKCNAEWDTVPVHEKLIGKKIRKHFVAASLLHYAIKSKQHFSYKNKRYAYLAALKYRQMNKKHAFLLRFLSPVFHFLKAYIFQLGMLDFRTGFTIARINAYYTHQKYEQLYQIRKKEKRVLGEMSFVRSSLKKIASFLS